MLDAALALFAEHGVSGTSLQMIADAVGITKAAVYHQFRTKEQIVLAVTERELGRLGPALEEAEAHGDGLQARDALLVHVIDMAVRDRRLVRRTVRSRRGAAAGRTRTIPAVHGPALPGALGEGEDGALEGAMLSGAISSGVMHPLVGDFDDDTLRTKLTAMCRRLLGMPVKAVAGTS